MLGSGWRGDERSQFQKWFGVRQKPASGATRTTVPLVQWAPWRQQSCRMLDRYWLVLAHCAQHVSLFDTFLNQRRWASDGLEIHSASRGKANDVDRSIVGAKGRESVLSGSMPAMTTGDAMAATHATLYSCSRCVCGGEMLAVRLVTEKACWSGLKTKHLLMKAGENAQLYPKEKEGR